MSIEKRYAAGKRVCIPNSVNFQPDVILDELSKLFDAGKARHLVLSEFDSLFAIEFLLSGYDTVGNDNEYYTRVTLAADTKVDALNELHNLGLHEYYSARFKDDYLAW